MPDKKIDGPDAVEFVKAAVQGIPDAKEHKRIMYELGGAYLLGKAIKHVTKGK